ncbi:hypothetical protein EDC40_109165 [Aminobacter aminovorans]|uniref:Transposase n=1 Tax=Aminobacter aminovorans TaxID=83263 RepID=A0A380WLT4_AMIAI|nr:hypothetical protein EDC40_109165 [Aminobacter aminovorans]SUU89196.1 Uncharacterised protein [Aminobacter aminovorans]
MPSASSRERQRERKKTDCDECLWNYIRRFVSRVRSPPVPTPWGRSSAVEQKQGFKIRCRHILKTRTRRMPDGTTAPDREIREVRLLTNCMRSLARAGPRGFITLCRRVRNELANAGRTTGIERPRRKTSGGRVFKPPLRSPGRLTPWETKVAQFRPAALVAGRDTASRMPAGLHLALGGSIPPRLSFPDRRKSGK